MYNKNTCQKIMYQVIVENKFCVEFNSQKKRSEFLKKIGSRQVTCISNVSYPWNLDDGIHNLKSPADFAKICGCDVKKVNRAIKNKKIKCERLGGGLYIVEDKNYYEINGARYRIDEE